MTDKDHTLNNSEDNFSHLESELKRSHKMFTSLLDSLDAIIYVSDINTNELLFINKYSRDIFGDVVGKLCWQALQTGQIGPCDFCTNDKLLTSEGKPKGIYHWEFKNTVNGRCYDIRDRAIEWIDGRIVRLEIATDITERKKAEDALIIRERQLAESQEFAHIGSWEWDIVTNRITWSKELFQRFGLSPQEFEATFEAFLSMVHPDDKEKLENEVKKSVANKTPYHIDVRIINPDGRKWVMEARGVVTCDESGNSIRMGGTAQDITERKQVEVELRERTQFNETLINLTPGVLYIYDIVDKKNVYSNNGLEKVLGYSMQEIVDFGDQLLPSLIHPDDMIVYINQTLPRYAKARDGEQITTEYRMRHKDGQWHWLASHEIIYLRMADGTPKQIFGMVTDITDRINYEKKLHFMSIIDDLTGLYNRRGFLTLVEPQLKSANRDNKKMFLMSADLDFLKIINDTVGHQKGDMAIIDVAGILKETFRESDIIARIGGDEFVVLGVDTPDTNIETLAERLRENINVHNDKANEPLGELSLSYGFAIYDPKHPSTIEELLSEADKLMYQHKKRTR